LLNGMNYDRIPVWNALKWVIKDPTSLKEILRLLSIQRAYKRSEKYAW